MTANGLEDIKFIFKFRPIFLTNITTFKSSNEFCINIENVEFWCFAPANQSLKSVVSTLNGCWKLIPGTYPKMILCFYETFGKNKISFNFCYIKICKHKDV